MDSANFLHFGQFWLFLAKKGQKGQNRKSGTVVNFHLLRGIYIPNFRKFHQTVWILPIFFIFGCFLVKKRRKKAEIKKINIFCSIFFVGKHLHTKFQKISSNGLDFANFLCFCQFWPFFVKKRPKKAKIENRALWWIFIY